MDKVRPVKQMDFVRRESRGEASSSNSWASSLEEAIFHKKQKRVRISQTGSWRPVILHFPNTYLFPRGSEKSFGALVLTIDMLRGSDDSHRTSHGWHGFKNIDSSILFSVKIQWEMGHLQHLLVVQVTSGCNTHEVDQLALGGTISSQKYQRQSPNYTEGGEHHIFVFSSLGPDGSLHS